MKVLFATSEAVPLVKTGGLADVSGALPAALRRENVDIRLLIPGYPAVKAWLGTEMQHLADVTLPPFPHARLFGGSLPSGVPVIVIDCPPLFDRPGGLYASAEGTDWPDNDLRFGLLSGTAALLAHRSSPLGWRPDILHCNDWQTGLAPIYLRAMRGEGAPTVFTIHNLAYQGIFLPGTIPRVGLPWELFRPDALEYYGNVSYLKAGCQFATRLTTVSSTYAREIQSEPLGFGLQGLLSWRSRDLVGILNGIDTDAWNPQTDTAIPARYGIDTLPRKDRNRDALRRALGLDDIPGVPVAGVVSRLTHQKGLDLLAACAEGLLHLPLQIAVLGSGDLPLELAFQALAANHPGQIGVRVGFDEAFSRLVEAGADFFLMPSRFEPSGLNQMYSQRYGTPVVARSTGGLADSVIDLTPESLATGHATGFLFEEATPEALSGAVSRAVVAFRNRRVWRRLQRNGMGCDFSWDASAREYGNVYRSVAGRG